MGKKLSLEGQSFGLLVVIERAGQDRYRRWHWLCSCACGNSAVIAQNNLRTGNSQSCGCQKRNASRRAVEAGTHKTSRGSDHYRWKPDRDLVVRSRCGADRTWAKRVMGKDGFRCAACGKRAECAHHINGYALHERQRRHASNGVGLCANCHKSYHRQHGKHATRDGFHEFMGAPAPDDFLNHDLRKSEIPDSGNLRGAALAILGQDLDKAIWYLEREKRRLQEARQRGPL